MLAAVGTVAMPLYYLLWHNFFPQAYENLTLRLTGVGICVAGLFARRFSARWLSRYLLFALSYILPFFFTFMFLNFPSGLVLYWLVNNVLTIIQQYYINKSIAASEAK